MKKAFITGINGQDGSYLTEYLLSIGYEVFGMIRRQSVAENQSNRIEHLINNKSKDNNIKVHAWINVYYLWSSKKHPVHNDHLLFQKPDWLDQRKNDKYISGKKFLNEKNNIYIDGEGFFLAPTNPDVNEYLIRVVSEISEKYYIDGIHYDYIRYPMKWNILENH